MAILDTKQRKASETLPGGRYPMPDKNHARSALGRVNQGNLSPEEKSKVSARAHRILGKGHYSDGAIHRAVRARGGE